MLRLIAYAVIGACLTVGLATGKMLGSPAIRYHPVLQPGLWAVHPAARDMTTALLTAIMVGTALRAASAIGREREQQTLDPLLVLPGGAAAVLRAKWLASILRNRFLASILASVWGITLLCGMLPIAAAFWLAGAAIVHAAFLASLGICISLVTRHTGRAIVLALFALVAAWTLPLLMSAYWLGVFPAAARERPWVTALLQEGLTPPLTWRFLATAAADPPPYWLTGDQIGGTFLGLGLYATAAWALWRLAGTLFRRAAGKAS